MPNRRAFLEQLGAGAMLATFPLTGRGVGEFISRGTSPEMAEGWDLSWTERVSGKYKAVFDVPEIESGYGVWRASVWKNQYVDVLKANPKECSPVVVLRHTGIALAMNQKFWDEYALGKKNAVKHPVTEQQTDRNPAMLSSARKEQPAMFDGFALDKFIANGGIALACDLAFDDMVALVTKKHKGTAEAARKTALTMLVPGVILQPSGVFAAVRAQDVGCKYVRAS